METSSSHDLSIDSVEVFEDSFVSTLSSQFLHSTPIKGTIHGKQEIVTVANTFEVFDESVTSEVLKAMKSCLTTIEAFPFLLYIVFNIEEWLSPHANELHSITQPKCFKICEKLRGKLCDVL
ncbi:PREDICTED: uncharacterized protein LOC107354269 isoform X2 [Acropora digitifera]|uniref:uncharacterized protein LOC107354269 isoform X2 n=1 Tax=Acropora digitifera TaxID=70779 RepID=UPI000779FA00|nr:PREDICTED: uncharacterized protein LOC107354269 isoform X2 [Acropora digitifera]